MMTSGVYTTQPRKWTTAVYRFNRIQLMRKIRIAKDDARCAMPARLVKRSK